MFAIALCGSVIGCGLIQPNNTAEMPNNREGGPEFNEGQAIAYSSYALMTPAYTHGNPARGARTVATEDWLAGQTTLTNSFGSYAPGNEWDWAQLRTEVRAAIGVSPQASSQELVDRMLATYKALKAGDKAAAMTQLSSPIFTLGPDRTLAMLSNLPKFQYVEQSYAELRANEDREYGGGSGNFR